MVRRLSIALGAGVLMCALGTRVDAQPLVPDFNPLPPDFNALPPDFDPLPPDFDVKINDAIQKAMDKAQEAVQKAQEKTQEKMFAFQNAEPRPMPNVRVGPVPPMPPMPPAVFGGTPADVLYQEARDSIDRERYEVALRRLNDLLRQFDGKVRAVENRVDAALYWKAYTLGKEQQYGDALSTLSDMQRRFADSRWLKDARALELELRQASGQAVSPDGQSERAASATAAARTTSRARIRPGEVPGRREAAAGPFTRAPPSPPERRQPPPRPVSLTPPFSPPASGRAAPRRGSNGRRRARP